MSNFFGYKKLWFHKETIILLRIFYASICQKNLFELPWTDYSEFYFILNIFILVYMCRKKCTFNTVINRQFSKEIFFETFSYLYMYRKKSLLTVLNRQYRRIFIYTYLYLHIYAEKKISFKCPKQTI